MKKFALLLALPLVFASCINWNSNLNTWDFATKWDIKWLQAQIDLLKTQVESWASKWWNANEQDKFAIDFNATIVSDDSGISWKLDQVKQNIFKKMNYNVVTSTSPEWEALIAKFNVKYLPMMVTWDEIVKTEIWQQIWKLSTKIADKYNVNLAWIASQMRIDIQKTYMQTPADLPSDWVKWPDTAKVTIIEVSDFECPYCSKFYNNAYPKLIEEYWDKIQFRFKNLPLSFHKDAQKAAESAQCAKRQWKFWEMHDLLFENNKNFSDANYKKWAKEIWLNEDEFANCLDNWETAWEVAEQAKQVWEFWISWTPWFFINNKFLGWAYPFESFKAIIDAELAK